MPIVIKWFPPSWIQIVEGETVVYIDPTYLRTYFLKYPKKIEYSSWPDPIDGLPEKLPAADIILITHHHKDHVKRVTVNRITKRGTLIVAPRACQQELGEHLNNVITSGDTIEIKGITITAVDAYNTSEGRSTKKNHRKGKGVGYVVRINRKSIYHAGDTDVIPQMKMLGPIDVAFLPIGGIYTMDTTEAIQASLMLKPTYVVPIHYLDANPQDFKQKLEKKSQVKVKVLNIGEEFII